VSSTRDRCATEPGNSWTELQVLVQQEQIDEAETRLAQNRRELKINGKTEAGR
jgi:hypothetical protein